MPERAKGLIIDLDGTVFRGDSFIPGAADAIRRAAASGRRIVYLSNRGNMDRDAVRKKLSDGGIAADREDILLSSSVAATFLSRYYRRIRVWTLGEEGLREELRLAGVPLADKPEEADWLVISLHERVTYEELNDAFKAARSGARILATNADRSFPRQDGAAIDVAGMIGAITSTTGRPVDIVVGKPGWLMAEAALGRLQLEPDECLVIGDSLESDIALGRMFGMKTALVLTGSTSASKAEASRHKPDYIWPSIAELGRYLD
jgi:arabinose operon protein AraL